MASYLLDAICTRNMFTGLRFSSDVSEFPAHVYFSVLWENRYKKSYTTIYDGFLARVYSLIFKKNYLRLSDVARNVISRIRQFLPRREKYLPYDFWSLRGPTPTAISCNRLASAWDDFLSDYIARPQCLPSEGQEKSIHSIWIICRISFCKGHHTSQERSSK
jgi:hypothetical protein